MHQCNQCIAFVVSCNVSPTGIPQWDLHCSHFIIELHFIFMAHDSFDIVAVVVELLYAPCVHVLYGA